MLEYKFDFPYNIFLASKSPRRQELLSQLGIDFQVVTTSLADETYPANLPKEETAVFVAREKALHCDLNTPSDLIIAADTIVWVDGQVLGKPKNHAHAHKMLRLLSGKMHSVITGVCLRTMTKIETFHVETLVHFVDLPDNVIDYYINTYAPYDKAGAYGIQEWIGQVGIDFIHGSYHNVVGLPVQRLLDELYRFCR